MSEELIEEIMIYKKFIEEKVEYVYKNEEKTIIDKHIILSTSELYVVFYRWLKEKYPDRAIKSLAQFRYDLCSNKELLPQQVKYRWLGIKLKDGNDFCNFYKLGEPLVL